MLDLLQSGSGKDISPSTSNFPYHCHPQCLVLICY